MLRRTAADWLQKFSFIEDSPIRQVYHAGVAYMDAVVGNITTLLKAKGMWESSLLVMSAVRARLRSAKC